MEKGLEPNLQKDAPSVQKIQKHLGSITNENENDRESRNLEEESQFAVG